MTTILVIDDEAVVRLHLRVLLEDTRYVVLDAANGHAALEAHRDRHVDAAIVNLALPETNAFEAIAALRERWPDIKIAILTGPFAPPEFDAETIMRKAQADAAFAKPFNDAAMLAQLERWIGRERQSKSAPPPIERRRDGVARSGPFAIAARERLMQLRNAFACIEQNEFPEANLFRLKRHARGLAELAADAGKDELARLALALRDLVEKTYPPKADARRRIGIHLDMIATMCVASDPARIARADASSRLESAFLKI